MRIIDSFSQAVPLSHCDSRNCCRRLVKALWILPRPPSLGSRSGIPTIPCNWCATFTLSRCSFLKILKTQTWENPTGRWVKSHWFEGEIHIFHDGWTKPYSSWPSLNVIMIILVGQFLMVPLFSTFYCWWNNNPLLEYSSWLTNSLASQTMFWYLFFAHKIADPLDILWYPILLVSISISVFTIIAYPMVYPMPYAMRNI